MDATWAAFLKGDMPIKPMVPGLEAAIEGLTHPERAGADAAFLRWLGAQTAAPEHERVLADLARSGTVAVVVNLYPALLGGPVSQLLKCLAAVKLCNELSRGAAPMAPIAWICERAPEGFPADSLSLISEEGELHTLQSHGRDGAALVRQIKDVGGESIDPEELSLVESTFLSDAASSSVCARFYSALMREWGMPAVDAVNGFVASEGSAAARKGATEDVGDSFGGSLVRQMHIQRSLFPALIWIVDTWEVEALRGAEIVDARLWPFGGATIVDSASRRTLDRYHLDPAQLYSGESQAIEIFERSMPRAVSERLRALVETTISELAEVAAAAPGDRGFARTAERSKTRIAYQLRNLRARFDLAANARHETARRRIHRACNFLAPNGRLQENELAAMQFPLRYSRTVLRSLCERLDVMNPEHQLISLD